jgi:UDP-N-acetylmuramoyl-tripeptide--D-alanyl-D-alanine ligase
MGLARAVNEHLATGTEVFVAEMGTYGPGEIRSLCSWVRPDVAVITALGPVHLERMGSLEAIAAAKREILENAPVAVIATEHPLLAAIADEESGTRRIIRVSVGHTEADVVATTDGSLIVEGEVIGTFDPTQAQPGNVAAAVGVAIALGIDPRVIVPRLADLPVVPHRQAIGRSERGFVVIDDTFNANPAGAKAALSLLSRRGSDSGRRVVVTPGMVELGREQFEANRAFAAEAGAAGVTHLLVVNRTNRAALLKGAEEGGVGTVILFETRDEAVRWVRETLVDGDAVLYENDLPDHYP